MMKRKHVVFIALLIVGVLPTNLLNYHIAQTQATSNRTPLSPTKIINYDMTFDGEYEIAEDETVLIANCTFIVHGSIWVYGTLATVNATIKVVINFPEDDVLQRIYLRSTGNLIGYNTTLKGGIEAQQNSTIDVCNLSLVGYLIGYDHSRLNLSKVQGINRKNNWLSFRHSSYGDISDLDSDLIRGVYLAESSRANINNTKLSLLNLQGNTKANISCSDVDVLQTRPLREWSDELDNDILVLPNSTVNVHHSEIDILKICGSSRVFLWNSTIEQVEAPPEYYEGNPIIIDKGNSVIMVDAPACISVSPLWSTVMTFMIGAVIVALFSNTRKIVAFVIPLFSNTRKIVTFVIASFSNTSLGKVLLKFLRAEIGLGMFIVSYVMFWVSGSHLGIFFFFCVIAGMALYVWDRKGFLNRRSGDKGTAVLLAILGLALIVINLYLGLFLLSWTGMIRDVTRSWTWKDSMIAMSYIALYSGLFFLFGWLLLCDGLRARFDIWNRSLPSKQGIDLQEAWKKYPKDLFDEYVRQYPHNPEGVLEWHINKKMKEGKTREQAIKELVHALLH